MDELIWCRANAPDALKNADDATLLSYMHEAYLRFVSNQFPAQNAVVTSQPITVPTQPVMSYIPAQNVPNNIELKRLCVKCKKAITEALYHLGAAHNLGTMDAASQFVRGDDVPFADFIKHSKRKKARVLYSQIESYMLQINSYGYSLTCELPKKASVAGFFDFFFDSALASLLTNRSAGKEIQQLNRLYNEIDEVLIML